MTSTKQTLDAVSDLVVLASDESKRFYLHNVLDLGTPTPRLVFGTQPSTSQLSVPFATQPVVVAQNGQGKTDTTFNGPVIMSIKAGTGTAGAALLGTVTRNAVAGVASFTDLSINKAGAGYQLSASAAGYVGATSMIFEITKVAQTLALDPIPQKRYGDPTFSVNATALISGTTQPSGLPVSYVDPTPGDACTVTSTSVQITNVGACTVRVSQAGDATYAPVTLDTTFVVQKANQSISFPQIPIKHFGDAPFVVNATASSGLAVSLVAIGACKINGNVVTLTGPDTCTIRASQAGNSLYNAAPDVSQTVRSNYMVYAPLSLN